MMTAADDEKESSESSSKELINNALRGMVVLLFIALWLILMREQGWMTKSGGGIFSLGFLLVAGVIGGKVAQLCRLPSLTGYLAVGVLSGPYVLELFTLKDVESLKLINSLALALIALQAGAELTMEMIKRSFKSLLAASIGHSLIIPTGMMLVFVLLSPYIPFLDGLETSVIFVLGLLWGAMAVSKAPADTLAILSETKAKGILAEYSLGVVVLLDVVVLVLFSLAMMFAKASLDAEAHVSLHVVQELAQEIFVSIAAGTTFGLAVAYYFWAIAKEKLLFIVVISYGITAFCAYFHYDTLLVFVVSGFVVMNLTKYGHELIHTTEKLGSAVMVVFFATAGAQLNVGALKTYGLIAVALSFARIFFIYLASLFGHMVAKDTRSVRKYGFSAFISQAGVTIGLASIAANELGEIGENMAMLVIATIGINEMIGPVAFKYALKKGMQLEDEDALALIKRSENPEAESVSLEFEEKLNQLLESIFVDQNYEIKCGENESEIFLLLDTDGRFDAKITVQHGEKYFRVFFRANYESSKSRRIFLQPKNIERDQARHSSDLIFIDGYLRRVYDIKSKPRDTPFVHFCAQEMLALADFRARIEIEGQRLMIQSDSIRGMRQLEEYLVDSFNFWKVVSKAEQKLSS